jgi:hypothetical protein
MARAQPPANSNLYLVESISLYDVGAAFVP